MFRCRELVSRQRSMRDFAGMKARLEMDEWIFGTLLVLALTVIVALVWDANRNIRELAEMRPEPAPLPSEPEAP